MNNYSGIQICVQSVTDQFQVSGFWQGWIWSWNRSLFCGVWWTGMITKINNYGRVFWWLSVDAINNARCKLSCYYKLLFDRIVSVNWQWTTYNTFNKVIKLKLFLIFIFIFIIYKNGELFVFLFVPYAFLNHSSDCDKTSWTLSVTYTQPSTGKK